MSYMMKSFSVQRFLIDIPGRCCLESIALTYPGLVWSCRPLIAWDARFRILVAHHIRCITVFLNTPCVPFLGGFVTAMKCEKTIVRSHIV
jgi:hypothetical protein